MGEVDEKFWKPLIFVVLTVAVAVEQRKFTFLMSSTLGTLPERRTQRHISSMHSGPLARMNKVTL